MENQGNQKQSGEKGKQQSEESALLGKKKPYSAPLLAHQKHLRDITLNPSPGPGESGLGAIFSPNPLKSGSVEGEDAGGMWEEKFFDD